MAIINVPEPDRKAKCCKPARQSVAVRFFSQSVGVSPLLTRLRNGKRPTTDSGTKRGHFLLLIIAVLCCAASCADQDYSPKPRGFFRIDFPERSYIQLQVPGCPFSFEAPTYSVLTDDLSKDAAPCWKNLDFPQFNARLHMSYFRISPRATFSALTEDARTFVFKHTAKATAIDQERIYRPTDFVYGLQYFIKGNTASNYQFYVSDSTHHYLRGALYFNERPHLDSIQPVLEFVRDDVQHLINTLKWK